MLDIAAEFSTYPSGRYQKDGTFNGEKFREELLVPRLKRIRPGENLKVVIDGVRTFGSSFLEEAFGGLVRADGFSAAELKRILEIVCTKKHLEMYKDAIQDYIDDAERERQR